MISMVVGECVREVVVIQSENILLDYYYYYYMVDIYIDWKLNETRRTMDISAKVELKERRRRERVRWNAEIILLLPSLEHYHGWIPYHQHYHIMRNTLLLTLPPMRNTLPPTLPLELHTLPPTLPPLLDSSTLCGVVYHVLCVHPIDRSRRRWRISLVRKKNKKATTYHEKLI